MPRNYVKDFDDPRFPHSSLSGYQKGCRCFECKRAKADYNIRERGTVPQFTKLLGRTPEHPLFPHGTTLGYRFCKCDRCRAANAQRKLLSNAKARQQPGARERQVVLAREYYATAAGKSSRRAGHARRRALKRSATVSTDKALIKLIYQHCPASYQVDHKVPLFRGGVHHPDNLQYLPAAVNQSKHTKLDFDCAAHAIRWQDVLDEPSTTIAQASRGKRPEVPGHPQGSMK